MRIFTSYRLGVYSSHAAKALVPVLGLALMALILYSNAFPQVPLAPVLNRISPDHTEPGGPGFVLNAYGSNFVSTSVVQWNGSDRNTTFVNDGQLWARIPASDITSPTTAAVTVITPGIGQTDSKPFSVANATSPPVLQSISPASATPGGPGFVLSAYGSNFVSNSIVLWNGAERATTFVNVGMLQANIPAGDIAAAGVANVSVFTPGPGASNSLTFSIEVIKPPPTLSGLDPGYAFTGRSGFVLHVTGSNFTINSVVCWNAYDKTTHFVDSHHLEADILASDLANHRTVDITVVDFEAGISNSLIFDVLYPPSLGRIFPNSAAPGGPGFVLYAFGSNFLSNSVIHWNGSSRTTRFVDSQRLEADIPAGDIAVPGSVNVSVFTPGDDGTYSLPFNVITPAPILTSIVPHSASAGGPGFVLMALASNSTPYFAPGSTIQWNGSSRDTIFVNNTHLQATILESDLVSPGTANITVWRPDTETSSPVTFTILDPAPAVSLTVDSGGAAQYKTSGETGSTQVGYATATNTGAVPSGTAILKFKKDGVTVSEVGVAPSPPTYHARIFIEYRKGVTAVPGRGDSGSIDINTGIAIVNYGVAAANATYTLRDPNGNIIAVGNGTIDKAGHWAKFIDQLKDVAQDFSLPSDFQTETQFGSLDIQSDQPLSVAALRGTNTQRNEFLITTTPVTDLSQAAGNGPVYFPQFADGGGYTTSLILMNTSGSPETGTLQILDNNGSPIIANQVGGARNSSFSYSIPIDGIFRLQTDGSPANSQVGYVKLVPESSTSTPVGLGIFSYNPQAALISESGIPAADLISHARIYMDLSSHHNTGVALVNPNSKDMSIHVTAFQNDGISIAGTSLGSLQFSSNGHKALFADEMIHGLPSEFRGVLALDSEDPFVALTIRSLDNERSEFLMTAFPVADSEHPVLAPILYPQIADGGGYETEFIFISADEASYVMLKMYGEGGDSFNTGN